MHSQIIPEIEHHIIKQNKGRNNELKISIVIPCKNGSKTIGLLLDSIFKFIQEEEVILVDDDSKDNTIEIASKYPAIKILATGSNLGPAVARNIGAENCNGEIILFLDSDVILLTSPFEMLRKIFKQRKDIGAVIGVYCKIPANDYGFWPNYKAIQSYYYYQTTEIKDISWFWASMGAIRKEYFFKAGKFDSRYIDAGLEDVEFGRRLKKITHIYLLKEFIVKHHFQETFIANARNHYKRGKQWMRIFVRDKEFDNYVSTKIHGLGKAAGFLGFVLMSLTVIEETCLVPGIFFMVLYFLSFLTFFKIAFKEKGVVFGLKTILSDFSFAVILGFAATRVLINYPLERKIYK
jgi:glycosyltransferase involved in cell wall biosynthesis